MAATRWGCHQEIEAREYYASLSSKHTSLAFEELGLFLNTKHPFIGASPDGLVSCSCCSEGICEIKVRTPFEY